MRPALSEPGRLVLVADDDPAHRALMREILEPLGFTVAEAPDGPACLALAKAREPALVLLDIAMPDQSGIDILRTIRQGQPNLPVLILSGYPAQQYALNLFKMGANGYLNKECDPQEIATAIRTVARGRRYITPAVAELLADGVAGGAVGGSVQLKLPAAVGPVLVTVTRPQERWVEPGVLSAPIPMLTVLPGRDHTQ